MLPEDLNAPDKGEVPVEGKEFSGTNVQVKGVDEPNIIKKDRRREYTLSNNIFSVVDVLENGTKGRRTCVLKLLKTPNELLFEDNYVSALGRDYDYRHRVYQRNNTPSTYSNVECPFVCQTRISKAVKPTLVGVLHFEGRYIKSREIEGAVRLVLQHDPLSSIWLCYHSYGSKITRKQTKEWNREIIQYSKAGNWLPPYKLRSNGGVQNGMYASCKDIYYTPNVFSGFNILTVATFPIYRTLSPDSSTSILPDADRVYANTTSMYVTTSEFRYNSESDKSARRGANYETSIHKFALSKTDAKYVASGAVTGSVINQFSISEYEDTLFMAATDGAVWWSNDDLSASKVTAFRT